jgi:hypothetical protein
MQWWNDFVDWFNSDDGWRIISTAIIPFLAIVVAGVIGALVGRGATRKLISWQDRELQSAAVAAMISVGDRASMWSSLPSGEKDHLDAQMSAADIRLRLLPITGSSAAADWASHELSSMQHNSANFSFQAEQSFIDYRDRLLEWQRRPGRARKLFAADLERFRFENSQADDELVEQQRKWAAEQLAEATKEAPPTAATPIVVPTIDQEQFKPVPAPEPIVPERTLAETAAAQDAAPAREAIAIAPVVAEPVVAEPVVAEPVVAEPVVAEPVVAEPVVAEPVVAEPVVAEPVVAEPVVAEPVAEQPATAQSAPEPVASEPETPAAPPLVVSTPVASTPAQASASSPASPVEPSQVEASQVEASQVETTTGSTATYDPQETQPYTGPIPTLASRTGSIPVQDERS